MAEAYPLHWPEGWPRTPEGKRKQSSSFQVEVGKAINELYDELERLGAKDIVLSSNLTLNTMHRPYAKQRTPDDPGIAVYFTLKEKQMVMARDGFCDWRDNIRSLGLAVEAFRALHRHGGAHMMERAFTGFAALPEPGDAGCRSWREFLCVGNSATIQEVETQYRHLRSKHHPDKGGDAAEFQAIQRAVEQARSELNNG